MEHATICNCAACQINEAKRREEAAAAAVEAITAGLATARRELIASLGMELNKAQGEINGLTAELREAWGTVDRLRAELKKEREVFNELEAKIKESDARLKTLTDQLDRQRLDAISEANTWKLRADSSERYAEEKEAAIKKYLAQNTALADSNEAYRRQVAGLTAELDHVRERLNRATALLRNPSEAEPLPESLREPNWVEKRSQHTRLSVRRLDAEPIEAGNWFGDTFTGWVSVPDSSALTARALQEVYELRNLIQGKDGAGIDPEA